MCIWGPLYGSGSVCVYTPARRDNLILSHVRCLGYRCEDDIRGQNLLDGEMGRLNVCGGEIGGRMGQLIGWGCHITGMTRRVPTRVP